MCLKKSTPRVLFLIFCAVIFTGAVRAQTTAFNFQGRLNDGANPANGIYDLQFKLFDAIDGGTQISSTVDRPNLSLVNGVFSTTLDFGTLAFAGGGRFLEISVRRTGSPSYMLLGARQQILAVPLAVTAKNSLSLGGVSASNYAQLNTDNQGNLSLGGNTIQPVANSGFVKALIRVGAVANVVTCYNGVTGVTTAQNCGFTVTQPIGPVGVYRIDFGFPVNGRFVSVATEYGVCEGPTTILNRGVNYRFIGSNLEVFTFAADNAEDTSRPCEFTVIVF